MYPCVLLPTTLTTLGRLIPLNKFDFIHKHAYSDYWPEGLLVSSC